MQQSDWNIKGISLDEILLDTDNVRLNVTGKVAQSSLLADLFNYENAMELVLSIVENGVFPDELPVVIEQDGKYIVIEGNRRIAALKAIQKPDIAPDSFATKIKNLGTLPNVQSVNVVIARSREATNKLIASKHTKTTRRRWKTLRQAYFYKTLLNSPTETWTIESLQKAFPEHNIQKFIRMLEMHKIAKSFDYPTDAALKVHDERNFSISTFERIYTNQQVQELLGFEFANDGSVKIKSDLEAFEKALQRIAYDIAVKIVTSRSLNAEGDIRGYIQSFVKEPLERISEPTSSEYFSENEPPKKESRPSKIKSQKGVIPGHISFGLNSSALKEMYKELRNISVKNFPNAAHDLLRSFLECSLVEYLKHINAYNKVAKDDRHTPKLGEMLTYLYEKNLVTDEQGKQALRGIKADYDKPYSLQRMNMVNHNPDYSSTEKDVRSTWGKMEKLMAVILNPGRLIV